MARKSIRQYELTYNGIYYGKGSIKELSERSGVSERSLRQRERNYRIKGRTQLAEYRIAYVETKSTYTYQPRNTDELMRLIIGDNVKRLMQEQGVSRSYLAEYIGVHYMYLERLERGGHCSIKLLASLVDFFQVEPLEMLENWKDRTVTDIGEEY